MGLFGGSRKLCPVCGKPASRFLPVKVEGEPLCGDCDGKVLEVPGDLRDSVLANMTALREYLAVYDENVALRGSFQETYRRDFGLFGGCICLDVPRRLLRLSESSDAFVFEPQNILSFRILEDESPLFEGTKDELVCYQSAIPDRVRGMTLELERFRMDREQYEQLERMDEFMKQQAEQTGTTYSPRYHSAPDVGRLNPFKKYYIHLELDHPYRKTKAKYKENASGFSDYDTSIEGYLEGYENHTQEMRGLAENLMAVINPDAPRRNVPLQSEAKDGGVRLLPIIPTSAAPADAVAEIQRYKGLLDSGAITEEEFTAKKRQLLGI